MKMKAIQSSIIAMLSVLVGCSTAKRDQNLSQLLPGYKPVPHEVIDDLPRRIERLPITQSMSGAQFLAALELKDYSSNISGSVRFNSHFLELDETHTLQIHCDPDSLIIRREDLDQVLNAGRAPRGGSRLNSLG